MCRTTEKQDLRLACTKWFAYLNMGLIIFVVSADVLLCSLRVRVYVLAGHFEGGGLAGHMEKTMKQSN